MNEIEQRYNAIIQFWQQKFYCLEDWTIVCKDDQKHYCEAVYSMKTKSAIIYPCDIEYIEDWVLNQILKLAFLSAANGGPDLADSYLEDLTALITTRKL